MPDKKRSVCGIGSCFETCTWRDFKNQDKTWGSWPGSEFEPVFLKHQTWILLHPTGVFWQPEGKDEVYSCHSVESYIFHTNAN